MDNYISAKDTVREHDSATIQAAVDLAHETGLNRVLIPRINPRTGTDEWIITETVALPSHMTVILDNCFMQMADGVVGGFFKSENLFTEWGTDPTKKMHDIHIKGEGRVILDGGKPTPLNEATQSEIGIPVRLNSPIFFINVVDFSVENIEIHHQRYWGMRFQFCSLGTVRNIRFDVCRDRRNQDGINLRNGCHHILLENVSGQTGDDMIALSAIDRNATGQFASYDVIVRDEPWDIHDITVRGVSGAAILHPLVTLRNHNGARIYNISIENLKDTAQLRPAYEEGNPWPHEDAPGEYTYGRRYGLLLIGSNTYYHTPSVLGDTYNITVKGLSCTYSSSAVTLGATVRGLRISDVYASGKCRAILTTGINDWGDDVLGVQMEDAVLSSVKFDCVRSDASVVDFRYMRHGDFVRSLILSDITAVGVDSLARVHERAEECDVRIGENMNTPLSVCRVAPPEVKRADINFKPFQPDIVRDYTR